MRNISFKVNENKLNLQSQNNNSECQYIDISVPLSKLSSTDSQFNRYNLVLNIGENTIVTGLHLKLKLDSLGVQKVEIMTDCSKDIYPKKEIEFYDNQCDLNIDLPIESTIHFSKTINITILKPKHQTSSKLLNIESMKIIGYKRDPLKLPLTIADSNPNSSSHYSFVHDLLSFLCFMTEQRRILCNEHEAIRFLQIDSFDLNDLWCLYQKSIDLGLENVQHKTLELLHELVKCQEIRTIIENSFSPSSLIQNKIENEKKTPKILDKLFELIDQSNDNSFSVISREILKNGIWMFFPTEQERLDYFLSMLDSSDDSIFNSLNQKPSIKLAFESLCNLFTSDKQSLIQHLTKSDNLFDDEKQNTVPCDLNSLNNFMCKIIKLILKMFKIQSDDDVNNSCGIVNALNALARSIQNFLFFKIREFLIKKEEKLSSATNQPSSFAIHSEQIKSNITNFLYDYIKLIMCQQDDFYELKNAKWLLFYFIGFFKRFADEFIQWMREIYPLLDVNVATKMTKVFITFFCILKKLDTALKAINDHVIIIFINSKIKINFYFVYFYIFNK